MEIEPMEKQQLLIQTMAFLLCTTPETIIGQLLQLCLAAKVDSENSGKTPLEFAEELLDHPEIISSWVSHVVNSDDIYSVEEQLALTAMNLRVPSKFMSDLFDEVSRLDTQGLSEALISQKQNEQG